METAMQRTLLLDAGMQPIQTISWQRAVVLLSLGKVEVVEEYDGFVRSQSLVIKIPAVVRLLRIFKKFRKPVKFSRINIYARDNYQCQYCGQKFKISDLTYDHVVPRAQGGKTQWNNIVTCCGDCNGKKRDRTPEQAGMTLISRPEQPKWVPALTIPLGRGTPDEWRSYLYWTTSLDEDR